jgi:uncharacterized protein Veg
MKLSQLIGREGERFTLTVRNGNGRIERETVLLVSAEKSPVIIEDRNRIRSLALPEWISEED